MTTKVQPDRVILLDKDAEHEVPIEWWLTNSHRVTKKLESLKFKYGWYLFGEQGHTDPILFVTNRRRKVNYNHGELIFLKDTGLVANDRDKTPIYEVVEVK